MWTEPDSNYVDPALRARGTSMTAKPQSKEGAQRSFADRPDRSRTVRSGLRDASEEGP